MMLKLATGIVLAPGYTTTEHGMDGAHTALLHLSPVHCQCHDALMVLARRLLRRMCLLH